MDPANLTTAEHRATRPIAMCVAWATAIALSLALTFASRAGAADEIRYAVRAGDNPWNLTERYLAGVDYWPRIQRLNGIADPTRLPPGLVLRIPVAWLRGTEAQVQVIASHGDVSRTTTDAARFEPLAGAVALASGSHVRTGADSHVTLQFVDGSRVLVLPGSELAIARSMRLPFGAGTVIQLDLIRGAVENLVRPREGPGGRFEIRTPAAVAAVRGTEFRVGADGDAGRSEVVDGAVRYGNASGERNLAAGFGTIAQAGKPPPPPIPLLPAPDLATMPAVVERVPFDVKFAAVPSATGYRVQFLSEGPDGSVQAGALDTPPRIRVPDLPDGRYVVRVRAIDPKGLEGFSADRPFTLHARPEPPVLLEPAPDAQATAERPALRWADLGGATTYRVQLRAESGSFDAPFGETTGPAPTFTSTTALAPGLYQWRVATIDPKLGQGPFSDPQGFRRVLPAPGVEAPEQSSDGMTLRWRAAGDGTRYALQLARDDTFAQPLVDETLDASRYLWKKPAPGTYFLHVRAIAADGFAGPWGTPQKIVVADDGPTLWPFLLLLLIPILMP